MSTKQENNTGVPSDSIEFVFVKTGNKITVKKAQLSPHLKKLAKESIVTIEEDVNEQLFMKSCISGSVPDCDESGEEELFKLLRVAFLYKVDMIYRYIMDKLLLSTSPSNIERRYTLALKYNVREVINRCKLLRLLHGIN